MRRKTDDGSGCEAATTTSGPTEQILFRAHTNAHYNYVSAATVSPPSPLATRSEAERCCQQLNPALLSASEEVVLAFAEARRGSGGDADPIDIAMRRSTDQGASFGAERIVVKQGNSSCERPRYRWHLVCILLDMVSLACCGQACASCPSSRRDRRMCSSCSSARTKPRRPPPALLAGRC